MGCEKKSSIISPEFENDYLQSSFDVISGEPITPGDDPMIDGPIPEDPQSVGSLNVKLLFTNTDTSLSVKITCSGMSSNNPLAFNLYRYHGGGSDIITQWQNIACGTVDNPTEVFTKPITDDWGDIETVELKITEFTSVGTKYYYKARTTVNISNIKNNIPSIENLSFVSPNRVKVDYLHGYRGNIYRNNSIVYPYISAANNNTSYIDTVPLPYQTYSYQIKKVLTFDTNVDISFQSNIATISTGRFTELYNISANASSHIGTPGAPNPGASHPCVETELSSISISGDLYVASNDYSNLTTKVYRSGSQYGTYELLDEFHGTDLYYSSVYTYGTNYFSLENGTLSYFNGYWNHRPSCGHEYWYKFEIIDHGYTYTTEPIYIYVPMPDGIQQL